MGEGDQQQTKQSAPAQAPANPARADAADAESGSAAESLPAPKAAGTVPPATRRAAAAHRLVISAGSAGSARPATPSAVQQLADAPPSSRTTTLDDPLTTSLLAEVARRSRTIDVSPEQIDEAMDIAPDDRDPDDSI